MSMLPKIKQPPRQLFFFISKPKKKKTPFTRSLGFKIQFNQQLTLYTLLTISSECKDNMTLNPFSFNCLAFLLHSCEATMSLLKKQKLVREI